MFSSRIIAIDTYLEYIVLCLSNGDAVILKYGTETVVTQFPVLSSIPSHGFKATLKFGDENHILMGVAEEESKQVFLISKENGSNYGVHEVLNVCCTDTDRSLDEYWIFEYCTEYRLFMASHPTSSELGLIQLYDDEEWEVLDCTAGENVSVPINEEEYVSECVIGMKVLRFDKNQYVVFTVESGNDAIMRIDRNPDDSVDMTIAYDYQEIIKQLSPHLCPQDLLSLSIRFQNVFQSHLDHARELTEAIQEVQLESDSKLTYDFLFVLKASCIRSKDRRKRITEVLKAEKDVIAVLKKEVPNFVECISEVLKSRKQGVSSLGSLRESLLSRGYSLHPRQYDFTELPKKNGVIEQSEAEIVRKWEWTFEEVGNPLLEWKGRREKVTEEVKEDWFERLVREEREKEANRRREEEKKREEKKKKEEEKKREEEAIRREKEKMKEREEEVKNRLLEEAKKKETKKESEMKTKEQDPAAGLLNPKVLSPVDPSVKSAVSSAHQDSSQKSSNGPSSSQSTGLFNSSTSQSTTQSTSLFNKPTTTSSATQTSGGLFNKPTTTTSTTQSSGGLFNSSTSTQVSGGLFNKPATTSTSTQSSGGLFNKPITTTSTTQSSGLFNSSTSTQASGGLFTKPTTTTSATSTSGGLFNKPTPTTSTTQSSGGLFNSSTSTPTSGGLFNKPATTTSTTQTSGGLFNKPAAQSSGGLFNPPTTNQSSGLFGKPATTQSGGLFGTTPAQATGLFNKPAASSSLFSKSSQAPSTGLFAGGQQSIDPVLLNHLNHL